MGDIAIILPIKHQYKFSIGITGLRDSTCGFYRNIGQKIDFTGIKCTILFYDYPFQNNILLAEKKTVKENQND